MSEAEVISWIFLSTAMASQINAADFRGISLIADGINHAVPSHKELQMSVTWLSKHDLVVKQGRKYMLTESGRLLYERASWERNNLSDIWADLEKELTAIAIAFFERQKALR